MPGAAVVDVAPEGRLVLRSPYDPALVEALKQAIPYRFREWQAAHKTWLVSPEWGDVLLQILTDLGVSIVDKRPTLPAPAAVAPALQHACAQLCIAPDAPLEVAEAAYKALAKRQHPDHGGDTATMQALNEAMQTFKAFNEVPF